MKMRVVEQLAIVFWCVMASFIAFSFGRAVLAGMYYGPFKDMWWMMPLVESYFSGHAQLQDFLVVHGGAHRLALPRILYLLDYGFFAGSNRLLVFTSLFVQGVAVVVWFLHVRALHLARSRKLFLWGLILLVCFSGIQLENVLYTFDCQWFLANTFALLALAFLVKDLTQSASVKNGLLTIFFGICASFCSFLGVCVLVLSVFIRVRVYGGLRHVWVQSLFAVLFVAWYVSGLETNAYAVFDGMPSNTPLVATSLFFLRLLQWTLIYIGSPLTRDVQWLGMLMAAGAIGYVLRQAFRFLRNPRVALEPPELFFLFASLFALAVAVATGVGRMYFINTADEDRYQTINMTFWLGLWLLLLSSRHHDLVKRCLLNALAVVWAGYVGVYWHSRDIIARLGEFDRVNASTIAQAVGVTDYMAIRDTLILGDKTRQINRGLMHRQFLQEHAWGAYAMDIARHYGQVITPSGKADSCQITPSQIELLSAGHWRFRMRTDMAEIDRVWLVDQKNVLRGAMVPMRWEYASAMNVFMLAPPMVEWLGYANLEASALGSMKALVFRDQQLVCETVISLF